jgi:SAM-dependent methyltransferase
LSTITDPPSSPVRATSGSRCAFCGGESETALSATDRNLAISDETFTYTRCTDCGTLALANVPADLGRYYPSAYYELPGREELDELVGPHGHKLELLQRFKQRGRLVEIGPGSGIFAYAARRAGFDVTGIERDGEACEHLREVCGVEAVQSTDPAAVLGEMPPSDAIALWQVIEHVDDPAAVLDAAAANLAPGGVLIVSTPNPQSPQFRALRGRWAHLDPPRHLFLLPLDAITARLERRGLSPAAVVTTDPAGKHCNRMGWEYALRRPPRARPASKPVAAAALAFAVLMRPVEHTGLRGATYTAVFVKGQ